MDKGLLSRIRPRGVGISANLTPPRSRLSSSWTEARSASVPGLTGGVAAADGEGVNSSCVHPHAGYGHAGVCGGVPVGVEAVRAGDLAAADPGMRRLPTLGRPACCGVSLAHREIRIRGPRRGCPCHDIRTRQELLGWHVSRPFAHSWTIHHVSRRGWELPDLIKVKAPLWDNDLRGTRRRPRRLII